MKSRTSGSGRASAISNQPRGTGPGCAIKIVLAMKSASSARPERIVGVTTAPPLESRVLQRNAELGLGLGLHLVECHALGELDQCHAARAVLVDGEDGEVRDHHVDHPLA